MYKIYFYKTKTSLGTCILVLSVFLFGHIYGTRLQNKVNILQDQFSHMNQQLARSVEIKSFMQNYKKEFEDFINCNFDSCLSDETLRKHQQYQIEIGPKNGVANPFNNSEIISQDVLIHIPCLMDKDVFRAINQLFDYGPGIFHIQEIEIKRLGSLSESILEKIAAGIPQILFEGRIKATWLHQ